MEFGGHLFDIPIIYTDPNASDFDESHTQGPHTVTVPRPFCYDSCDGQNRETCSNSDPSVVHRSDLKSHGQNQDLDTATELRQNDSSKQVSESKTDYETKYESIQHPSSRQSDPTSTSAKKPSQLWDHAGKWTSFI